MDAQNAPYSIKPPKSWREIAVYSRAQGTSRIARETAQAPLTSCSGIFVSKTARSIQMWRMRSFIASLAVNDCRQKCQISATGWTELKLKAVDLAKGANGLKLLVDTGVIAFDWIDCR
jgi:hypothetical protein